MSDEELAKQLYAALKAAQEHLEYCGWGDSWERDCAFAAKTPEKVESALDAFRVKYERKENV